MKAVRFSRFGRGSEVAEIVDIPEPDAPGAGQVLLELQTAPINPSDLLHFAGRYATPAPLPSFAGGGVLARVIALGAGVTHLSESDPVIVVDTERRAWRERFLWPAAGLTPLPNDVDPVHLALLAVNPPTAMLMLERFGDLKEDDWVIQNVANSSVGVSLIQIAKSKGLRTVNIVRRESAIQGLVTLGADVVLLDGPDIRDRVAQAVLRGKIKVGMDAVAGDGTRRLAACVADGGVVVNYGLLSGKPCEVDSADVLFRDVTLKGFWYTGWLYSARLTLVMDLFARLVSMLRTGTLRIPVEAVYPVRKLNEALAHAEREGRQGKVLLRWVE